MRLEEMLNLEDFDRSWTFQQTLDYANTSVIVEDHTMYSIRYLPTVFPNDLAARNLVCNTFYAAASAPDNAYMLGMWNAFNGEGLDFAHPDMGPQLEMLASFGKWSDEVLAAMKAIGIKSIPYWQSLEVVAQPTVQQIANVMVARQITNLLNGIQQQIADSAISIDSSLTADTTARSIVADFFK